jgi:hypothetical protein
MTTSGANQEPVKAELASQDDLKEVWDQFEDFLNTPGNNVTAAIDVLTIVTVMSESEEVPSGHVGVLLAISTAVYDPGADITYNEHLTIHRSGTHMFDVMHFPQRQNESDETPFQELVDEIENNVAHQAREREAKERFANFQRYGVEVTEEEIRALLPDQYDNFPVKDKAEVFMYVIEALKDILEIRRLEGFRRKRPERELIDQIYGVTATAEISKADLNRLAGMALQAIGFQSQG